MYICNSTHIQCIYIILCITCNIAKVKIFIEIIKSFYFHKYWLAGVYVSCVFKFTYHCWQLVFVWPHMKRSLALFAWWTTQSSLGAWISCRAERARQMSPRVLFYFWTMLLSALMGLWQWYWRCPPALMVCYTGSIPLQDHLSVTFVWMLNLWASLSRS